MAGIWARRCAQLLLAVGIALLSATAAGAQAADAVKAQPGLEAASVRWLCRQGPGRGCNPRLIAPPQYDPARFVCNFCNLASMVNWAYAINANQFKGMPTWAYEEVYRTVIVSSSPATRAQMKGFMRAILAKAFDLRCHVEQEPTPVFRLEVGTNGPKFRRAGTVRTETKAAMMAGARQFETVQQLVGYLNSIHYQSSPIVAHPVEDGTGLKGNFDIVLNLGQTGPTLNADLMGLVKEQLGLTAVVVPGQATHLIIDEIAPRRTAWTKG